MGPSAIMAHTAVALGPPPADPRPVDRVQRLGGLQEQGLLTDGEFTAVKAIAARNLNTGATCREPGSPGPEDRDRTPLP